MHTRGMAGACLPLFHRSLPLSLVVCILLVCPAFAQISGQQMRDRYEKTTKGTSIDDFVKKLNSDDAEKRLEGVKSLRDSKDNKAIEYLIQATGDSDIRVQAKAVAALGDLRATDATPVLIQYLSRRTVENNMKQLILASLGKIGDSRAARPIMEFLQRDLDPATRGTAIFALGEIGAPEATDTLGKLAQTDEDQTVRRLANEALAKVQRHQAAMQKEVKGPSQTFLPKEPPPQ
jgi:HEAT repeat protein